MIEYHYRNIIPYVFLSVSTHQLHHSGQFDIEPRYYRGDYMTFFKEKYQFLDKDDKEMINTYFSIDIDEIMKE